jgi:2-oxoglutarate dehydrogenase E2 component (dihydrolipoamide succinyltransferase)
MVDITIPKLNTVDTRYTVIEWLFPEGATVPAAAAVAVVETSKATQELVCEEGGVLHRLVDPPSECELGAVIGRLFPSDEERRDFLAAGSPDPVADEPADLVITKAARDLIDRLGVTTEQVRSLGKRIITGADIQRLSSRPAGDRYELPRTQRAIARVVDQSHRTIPAAFTVVKVEAGPDQVVRDGVRIGVPERVISAVAGMVSDFPLFFARLVDDTAVLPDGAHVGVTVDVGTGLYVPVVRDAQQVPLVELARRLTEFRVQALRCEFRETELTGATIAVSLNDEPGVVLAQPLILPPLVAMLSVGATQPELYFDGTGEIRSRRCFHLGLAYDHRLINGRDAVLFLKALTHRLEERP